MPEPKQIGVLELRSNLTTILTSVSAGTTYVVTRFGQPLVTIGPVEPDRMEVDASGPTHRKPATPLRVEG